MKDILDVLCDYSYKGQYIDSKAIEKIIKSYKKEFNIDILKTINIYDRFEIIFGRLVVGTYLDDYIDIYYNRIRSYIYKNDYKSKYDEEDQLSIFEGFFRRNLFILFNICHELEHAIQAQIASSYTTTLEEKLIKLENNHLDTMGQDAISVSKYNPLTQEYDLTFMEHLKYILAYNKQNRIYKHNYDISLLERLADIDSMTKLYNMCKEIESKIPTLYKLMNKLIIDRKLLDYDKSFISPTTEFFINITGERQFYFPDYIDMTLDERLRLGLPINTKEYEETKLKLKH